MTLRLTKINRTLPFEQTISPAMSNFYQILSHHNVAYRLRVLSPEEYVACSDANIKEFETETGLKHFETMRVNKVYHQVFVEKGLKNLYWKETVHASSCGCESCASRMDTMKKTNPR